MTECFFTNTRHGVGDFYACERGATRECIKTNTRYGVGDFYACERGAAFECSFANTRHGVGDFYACERGATIECITTNTRYGVGDFYACERGATREYRIRKACHSISELEMSGNACAKVKITVCIILDRYFISQFIFSPCAIKRIKAYMHYTMRHRNYFNFLKPIECILGH